MRDARKRAGDAKGVQDDGGFRHDASIGADRNKKSEPCIRAGSLEERLSSSGALATSQGRLKGAFGLRENLVSGGLLSLLSLAGFAPFGAMFDDPVREGTFKADIVPGFLGLDPLVLQNLFALGLELAIKRRVLQQVSSRRIFRVFRHT
jgi:hypothetical protein